MGRDAEALWIPSPFHWSGRQGHSIERIVIHGTAGGSSAQGTASWFQNPQAQVSSHYIVGQDGTIVCSVDEDDAAWGNGVLTAGHASYWNEAINPNLTTISIEHVKPDTENATALTLDQQEASFGLIARICERHNIPRNTSFIVPHASLDPQNRAHCPGNFNWDGLIAALNGGTHMARVPLGWSDDGTTLTAPNGVPVRAGFRGYILNNPWKEEDMPLQPEQGRAHLEMSNPGLGGGTRLVCRETILEWTPQRGVFQAWGGVELLKLESMLHL